MRRLILIVFGSALVGCKSSETSVTPNQDALGVMMRVETLGMTVNQIFDHVREFVHNASDHDSYFTYGLEDWETEAISGMLLRKELTKLQCGQRARQVMSILYRLGYSVRLVNLLGRNPKTQEYVGHALVEAYSPDVGRWKIIDADYNVFYSNGTKRLSLRDIIELDFSEFSPCRGNVCDWNLNTTDTWQPMTPQSIRDDNIFAGVMIHPGQYHLPKSDFAGTAILRQDRVDTEWLKPFVQPAIPLGEIQVLQSNSRMF